MGNEGGNGSNRRVGALVFFNFKYSRGDPHCKDFIILKNNKKNNTTVQRGSGDKRSQGATTKRTAPAVQAETSQQS